MSKAQPSTQMVRTVALYLVQPSSDVKGTAAMADEDAVLAMMHSSRWTTVRGCCFQLALGDASTPSTSFAFTNVTSALVAAQCGGCNAARIAVSASPHSYGVKNHVRLIPL